MFLKKFVKKNYYFDFIFSFSSTVTRSPISREEHHFVWRKKENDKNNNENGKNNYLELLEIWDKKSVQLHKH